MDRTRKRDRLTDGRTVRLLYASQSSFGGIKKIQNNPVNSLDPDQARQYVGPDQDSKLFDTLMVFLKEFFEKVDYEKKQTTKKKNAKITQ